MLQLERRALGCGAGGLERSRSARALSWAVGLGLLTALCGCEDDDLSGEELVWVDIPAGSFLMGCTADDAQCGGPNGLFGETPQHRVEVPAFQMSRTETTQYQYWKVTGEQPSHHPRCGDCPVEYMQNHYHDAKAFCEAVGGRLPSEAEWEYAARAGSTTRYICGDDPACLDAIAWHAHNTEALDPNHLRHPQPVGQKQPNAFGLYDMTGNVQEWTEDCSHSDYQGAPEDGSAWMTGGDCSRHVFKGSTYNTEILPGTPDVGSAWLARPSGRYWDIPDTRGIADGFRCARDNL